MEIAKQFPYIELLINSNDLSRSDFLVAMNDNNGCKMNKKQVIDYYDNFYYKDDNVWTSLPKVYPTAIELLKGIEAEKILDIGCGFGGMPIILARTGKSVTGLDISKKAVKKAVKNSPENAQFIVGDAERIPLKACFDAVICLEVMEHMEHPEMTIEEISRLLKNGGKLIISFPNYANPYIRRMAKKYAGETQPIENAFTIKTIKKILGKNFRIKKVVGVEYKETLVFYFRDIPKQIYCKFLGKKYQLKNKKMDYSKQFKGEELIEKPSFIGKLPVLKNFGSVCMLLCEKK